MAARGQSILTSAISWRMAGGWTSNLLKEIRQPKSKRWIWTDFWIGGVGTITPRTKTITDDIGLSDSEVAAAVWAYGNRSLTG